MFIVGALTAKSPAQTSATVSLDKAVYKAGEAINGSVTLDVQSPCNGIVFLELRRTNGQGGTEVTGGIQKGQQTISVATTIPFDDPGEEYDVTNGNFRCDNYQRLRPLAIPNPIHITILPIPDTNAYPTQAKFELTVSQKQFLETKTHELDNLLVRFANGVEQFPSTTEGQKTLLVPIIEAAQSDLNDTEKEYREQILKPNEPIPVFFEDFREHYQDLEVEVKARKTNGALQTPRLVLAQLKKRPNQQPPPAKPSTTLTPDAEATSHLIEDNKRAYTYVEETGGDKFTTALISIPDGARVSYRRTTLPDFIDYPTPTNVNAATLPMAYLLVRFHKDNCGEDQFLQIDPWEDPKAPIEMEFTKCH